MEPTLMIGLGALIIAGSLYFLMRNKPMANKPKKIASMQPKSVIVENAETEEQLLEGLDLSRFDPIPQPQSKKPAYVLIVLACFSAMVLLMMNSLNAQTAASSFWLFVAACICFGFGCYFMSWVRQADNWLLEDEERVTKINDLKTKQKKQVIDNHLAPKEAAAEALFRATELTKRTLQEKTAIIDSEIIQSNETEARAAKIPVTAFTNSRTEDFNAQIKLKNLEKGEKIQTDAENERAINKANVETQEAHNVLTETERTKFNSLSTELIDAIFDYQLKIEKVNNDSNFSEAERVIEIQRLEAQIKNQELQLNGLQTRLLQATNGKDEKGITPASKS